MKYITFFTSWILDRFSHKSCPNWPNSLRLCWKAALFSQDTEADGGRRADSGTSWRFWTCSCSKVRSPKTPAIISFSQTGSKKWVAEIIAFRGRPGSLRHSGLKKKEDLLCNYRALCVSYNTIIWVIDNHRIRDVYRDLKY